MDDDKPPFDWVDDEPLWLGVFVIVAACGTVAFVAGLCALIVAVLT